MSHASLCQLAQCSSAQRQHSFGSSLSRWRQSHRATYLARINGRRSQAFITRAALVLTPIGDGSCDHLEGSVPLPKEIRLGNGLFEVGREAPADIVVSVPTVSTRHAMLRLEDDTLSITDLNSTNGTYVDDEELVPMRAMEVAVGAEVIFGDMFLAKFKLEDKDK